MVHAFEQDGWVSHITVADDGRVFWVREDTTLGTIALDAHEVETNTTTLDFADQAPDDAVWDVQFGDDMLFWTDRSGLHGVATDPTHFGMTNTFRGLSDGASLFHFTVTDDALWYTESIHDDPTGERTARLGCFDR